MPSAKTFGLTAHCQISLGDVKLNEANTAINAMTGGVTVMDHGLQRLLLLQCLFWWRDYSNPPTREEVFHAAFVAFQHAFAVGVALVIDGATGQIFMAFGIGLIDHEATNSVGICRGLLHGVTAHDQRGHWVTVA